MTTSGANRKPGLLVVALFAALYLLPLGVRPLVNPDECRYAEVPREMVERSDWVVPRLNGVRYLEKPPAFYWCGAVSQRVLGESPFAVRLPSVLATALAAAFVVLLLRRQGLSREHAWLGGLALATTPLAFVLGTACDINAPFAALLTAGIGSFYLAFAESEHRARAVWLVVAGVACGLAFLTKGFLAWALPVLAFAPFMAWERRFLELVRWSWIPILVALVVVAPWGIAIELREPGFWTNFVVNEHFRRFAGDDAQHAEPAWYYVPILLAGALPWVALLPASLAELRHARGSRSSVRFVACWLVGPFLFFSACRGKLPSYVLPVLPPLVMLVVAGLARALASGRVRGLRIVASLQAVGLVVVAVVLALPAIPATHVAERLPVTLAAGVWLALALAAAAGAAMSVAALVARNATARVLLHGLALVPLFVGSTFVVPRGDEVRMPEDVLESVAGEITPDTILVSASRFVCAVSWVYRRDDVKLLSPFLGELADGLQHEDASDRVLEREDLRALVLEPGRKRRVVLAVRSDRAEGTPPLPPPTRKHERGGVSVWVWDPPAGDAE